MNKYLDNKMTNNEILKLLQLFCSDDERRTNLLKPFNCDGGTIATDGKVMVFYEKEIATSFVFDDKLHANCSKYMTGQKFDIKYQDLPVFKEVVYNKEIHDEGGKECPECFGAGCIRWENDYNDYCEECKNCDGGGKVSLNPKYKEFKATPVKIPLTGCWVSDILLTKFKALPEVQIQAEKIEITGPLSIKWKYGKGILMPIAIPE